MYEQVAKAHEKKSQTEANTVSQMQNSNAPTSRFVDNRPEAIQMRRLRDLAKNSPQNAKLRELNNLAAAHSVTQKKSIGKQGFGFVDNREKIVAQRKRLNITHGDSIDDSINKEMLQMKMISDPSYLIWDTTAAPNLSSFTISPEPNVTTSNETATTKPDYIDDMDNPEIKKVIMDPSRGNKQRLTKMHMIRGRFGGPGSADNLRLGTALSNNSHSDSHYHQVEKPIGDYIKGGPTGTRAVDYRVGVGDNSTPAYLTARLAGKSAATVSFVDSWCPSTFDCRATFYHWNGTDWFKSQTQQEIVPLDTGT